MFPCSKLMTKLYLSFRSETFIELSRCFIAGWWRKMASTRGFTEADQTRLAEETVAHSLQKGSKAGLGTYLPQRNFIQKHAHWSIQAFTSPGPS